MARRRGCLSALFAALFGSSDNTRRWQRAKISYTRRPHLLTPAEAHFFRALQEAVGQRALIFAKVRLGDLVQPHQLRGRAFYQALERVNQKHIDFVLCEPASLQPFLAVELDDASHQRADRAARDAFVDAVFASVGLAVLHVPLQREYPPRYIDRLIREAVAGPHRQPAPSSIPIGTPLAPAPQASMPTTATPAPPEGTPAWTSGPEPGSRPTPASAPEAPHPLFSEAPQRPGGARHAPDQPAARATSDTATPPREPEPRPIYLGPGLRADGSASAPLQPEPRPIAAGPSLPTDAHAPAQAQQPPAPPPAPNNQPPFCSDCGIPMVVRTVRQGQHAGAQFYGCANYPSCRQMRPLQRQSGAPGR